MSSDSELRLYCIMRSDLNAPVGKLMAQAGHAFVGTTMVIEDSIINAYWCNGAQPKIVLKVDNLADLIRAMNECANMDIIHYLVEDEGRTVFSEATVTCLGIGPVARKDLPEFIRNLPLY